MSTIQYTSYLNRNRYDIEFLGSTAVITSSSTKYIYVPNQWFVIASYAVDIYEELQLYKEYFKKIAARLSRRPETYTKLLRDSATLQDRNEFMDCAKSIFSAFCSDDDLVDESSSRLWRFVNDYSWWSGQKTIDRGDFHLSVILNMLNLVNASQSYVGDIVSAYANDPCLKTLVKSIDGFTVNLAVSDEIPKEKMSVDAEVRKEINIKCTSADATIPKPERVKIKISGSNTLKEIKYRS